MPSHIWLIRGPLFSTQASVMFLRLSSDFRFWHFIEASLTPHPAPIECAFYTIHILSPCLKLLFWIFWFRIFSHSLTLSLYLSLFLLSFSLLHCMPFYWHSLSLSKFPFQFAIAAAATIHTTDLFARERESERGLHEMYLIHIVGNILWSDSKQHSKNTTPYRIPNNQSQEFCIHSCLWSGCLHSAIQSNESLFCIQRCVCFFCLSIRSNWIRILNKRQVVEESTKPKPQTSTRKHLQWNKCKAMI